MILIARANQVHAPDQTVVLNTTLEAALEEWNTSIGPVNREIFDVYVVPDTPIRTISARVGYLYDDYVEHLPELN